MGGGLSTVTAPNLGAVTIKEAISRSGIEGDLLPDEVLMGNVIQAGIGQNPARQASIQSGLSVSVPATTINKVCGSGIKTIVMAAQAIKAGDADYMIAGGMESMKYDRFYNGFVHTPDAWNSIYFMFSFIFMKSIDVQSIGK